MLIVEKKEADVDLLGKNICEILEQALLKFNDMRLTEGAKLKEDVLSRLVKIEELVSFAEERSPQTIAEYRAKLEARLQRCPRKQGDRREQDSS